MPDDPRHISGLKLLDATRLSITNANPHLPAISVNGAKLSYQDVELGALQLTDTTAKVFDPTDGQFHDVFHRNSTFTVQAVTLDDGDATDDDDQQQPASAQLVSGQIIPAGDSLFKQASPAPIAYIDTSGRLGSANLWRQLFVANVMGYVDVDKGTNTYRHGLVPEGAADHQGLFLRKDGQWGQPSVHSGSVSETLLSLRDTPQTYTDHLDKYLRVSYAEGGSVVFDAIDTSKVPEATNQYYTDARVDARITTKLSDRSLTDIHVSGDVTANDFTADSDRRLKTRIRDMTPAECLAAVSKLHPASYRFKDRPEQPRFGLIAQEVRTVLPQVVRRAPDGQLSLAYIDLVPLLIGAVHDLQNKICALTHTTPHHVPL